MKILINRKQLAWTLRSAERGLLALAICLLSPLAFTLADTWHFQRTERNNLQVLLADREETTGESGSEAPITKLTDPKNHGGLVGSIQIARLGLSAIVMEGTGKSTLQHAVGHITNSGTPGSPGNIGLAGHRDTFFRPLRNIEEDDVITLTTPEGEFNYRVVSTRIVDPYNVAVLDASSEEVLTLVTCYPFYFVGPAPDRFIVRAERIVPMVAKSF